MSEVYCDEFVQELPREDSFLEFLHEREENACWVRWKVQDLKVRALESDPDLIESLQESYEETGVASIIEDTLKNTGLTVEAEACYPLRNCAIKTLMDRARISGNALRKVKKPVFAEILNRCLKVGQGDALLRLADGKVSEVLSGDAKDYSILPIPELFQRTVEYLDRQFPGKTFAGGCYSHAQVTALWELTDSMDMLDAYRDALRAHGCTVDDFRPALRLTSSDVGVSSANLYPTIFKGAEDRLITLGNPLKVKHKNGATLEDFDKNLNLIFAQYAHAVDRLTALLDIEILYPYTTLLRVMKFLGLGKKLALETADLHNAQYGPVPCSAHDLYCDINEILYTLQSNGADSTRIASMEETIARAMNINWPDYDMPGEFAW